MTATNTVQAPSSDAEMDDLLDAADLADTTPEATETAEDQATEVAETPAGEAVLLLSEGGAQFLTTVLDLADFPSNAALLGDEPSDELRATILAIGGLTDPITLINYNPAEGGPVQPFQIGSGRRRLKALRYLKAQAEVLEGGDAERFSQVPVRITVTSDAAAPLLQIVSHSTRRANPAVELAAIEKLMAGDPEKGIAPATVKQIAKATGLKTGAIKQILILGRLHPRIRQALDHEGLPTNTAYRIARFKTHEAQQPIADMIERGEKVTMKMVTDMLKAYRADARGDTVPDMADAPTADDFDDTDTDPAPKADKNADLAKARAYIAQLEATLAAKNEELARVEQQSNDAIAELTERSKLLAKTFLNEQARRLKGSLPFPGVSITVTADDAA
jgi:hypothetical protein